MASKFFNPKIKNKKAYKLFLLLVLLIVVNCTSADSRLPAGISQKKKNIATSSQSISRESVKKYTVAGKVTQIFPYCGGAQPSKEILERLSTPVAYGNKKFYIRMGNENKLNAKIVKSFVTDSSGFFSIQLQPGTYSIILEEQLYKPREENYKRPNQKVNLKCLNEWWAKPYYLLKVTGNSIADLKFNFNHRCFIDSDIPCISYIGPPRP